MPTYDLTRPVEDGMPTYPDDPPVSVAPHATHEADGYRVTALSLGSHSGTHVDAPAHTEPDGATLGAFAPEAFRFRARRVDLRGAAANESIPVDHLPDPAPSDADLLVLHTGWDDHWGTARALAHPYLAPEAAAWCADREYSVATDAMSVDPSPSPDEFDGGPTSDGGDGHPSGDGLAAHHAILGAERLILENLVGLARLPRRFELSAHPLALDADGAPVRAVAVVDGTD